MNLTPEQEALIRRVGKSVEEFGADVKSAPSPLAPVKADITALSEKAVEMQGIDDFTLQQTVTLDEKTVSMQDIDDFTLQMVFGLQAQIDELKAEIETLKGGTNA